MWSFFTRCKALNKDIVWHEPCDLMLWNIQAGQILGYLTGRVVLSFTMLYNHCVVTLNTVLCTFTLCIVLTITYPLHTVHRTLSSCTLTLSLYFYTIHCTMYSLQGTLLTVHDSYDFDQSPDRRLLVSREQITCLWSVFVANWLQSPMFDIICDTN